MGEPAKKKVTASTIRILPVGKKIKKNKLNIYALGPEARLAMSYAPVKEDKGFGTVGGLGAASSVGAASTSKKQVSAGGHEHAPLTSSSSTPMQVVPPSKVISAQPKQTSPAKLSSRPPVALPILPKLRITPIKPVPQTRTSTPAIPIPTAASVHPAPPHNTTPAERQAHLPNAGFLAFHHTRPHPHSHALTPKPSLSHPLQLQASGIRHHDVHEAPHRHCPRPQPRRHVQHSTHFLPQSLRHHFLVASTFILTSLAFAFIPSMFHRICSICAWRRDAASAHSEPSPDLLFDWSNEWGWYCDVSFSGCSGVSGDARTGAGMSTVVHIGSG